MQKKHSSDSARNVPLYIGIYDKLKKNIVDGDYPYGKRLPSRKTMAAEMHVSVITVKHAYELLCDEGYVEARERSGYYVIFRKEDGFASTARVKSSPWEEPIEQVQEKSSLTFPFTVLSRRMRRVMSDYGEDILQKTPGKGSVKLREAIGRYLARNRNIHVGIKQSIVGSGAEYLYGFLVGMLGKDLVFALESPSYKKIEQVYRNAGVTCELLPLGKDGIDSKALTETNASILHISPYRSFPSGVTASASKKYEYIRWASRPGHFIIEDDFESEFSLSSKPEETMFALSGEDNVIYMNTFTLTLSPSFRVGYMVIPQCLVEIFERKLGFFSCTVPTFEQLVIADLLDSGEFERHINRVRRKKRRES